MAMVCRRYLISGRVQWVGYRYFAVRMAKEAKVSGWVRNLADGRVEAVACGRLERLEEFEGWLWKGPPAGEVRSVEIEEAGVDVRIEGFQIR